MHERVTTSPSSHIHWQNTPSFHFILICLKEFQKVTFTKLYIYCPLLYTWSLNKFDYKDKICLYIISIENDEYSPPLAKYKFVSVYPDMPGGVSQGHVYLVLSLLHVDVLLPYIIPGVLPWGSVTVRLHWFWTDKNSTTCKQEWQSVIIPYVDMQNKSSALCQFTVPWSHTWGFIDLLHLWESSQ